MAKKSEKITEKNEDKSVGQASVKKPAPKTKTGQSVIKSKAVKKKAISPEEIRIQAYFVSQKRLAAGLDGDEASDWIQAEKDLQADGK